MADRTVVYRLMADTSAFKAQMAAASASVKGAAESMTASTKEGDKFRQGLASTGRVAGSIGLVAAAGLGAAIASAANFDESMSHVQAATHETAGNMEQLRAAALKAGADTAFSATEAAGGIEELAKAGVSTADILAGGLTGALNLAAAGGLEVGKASEIAASALTQFKLQGSDVPHVADLLAAAAGKAQGSVEDMGMALNQSGLVAAQTGLTIEETTGTLAAFASAGLTGSDAGTSFKQMLLSLTPSSTKAKELMDQLGISAYDAQGNFIGMAAFADNLKSSLAGMSQEQQSATLKTIFGSDAVRAASIIYQDGSKGIQGWIDKTNEAGYAADTAALRMDNLKGDLEQLRGSLETALIGTGEGAQGPLRSLVQHLTEVVNAFTAIPGPAKSALSAVLGVTAIAGGGIWAGSKVVAGITSMRVALKALGLEADTTKAKLATMGAATATAAIGIDTFLTTMSQMDSWQRSRDAADATVKSFQDLNDALSYSNVGKYAADLHIDLGRLAQDLSENGTQGEYATRVMDELTESSHGFGAMLNAEASHMLPFWEGSAEKAYSARKDLNAIIQDGSHVLGRGTSATEANAGATGDLGAAAIHAAPKVQTMTEEMKKQRQTAHDSAEAFVNLGQNVNKAKVSLDDWIKHFQKQAQALKEFRVNAQTAAKRGLDEGLIQSLQDAGTEGALRLKQLANASKSELDKANKAWRASQAEVRRYTDFIAGVPQNVSTHVEVSSQQALAAILTIRARLAELQDKQIHVDVVRTEHTGVDYVSGGQRKAGGGQVFGPGTATSDSIPAYLSNREYVMPVAAVDHYGVGFMEAVRARRYAEGGMVARSASVGSPSVNVGGTSVRVFIDGNEVRAVVRSEQRANDRFEKRMADR